MRKTILKTLVVGITLLFIALAFQPTVSTNEVRKGEVDPKQYLFETIIEIKNNPDINEILSQIEDNWNNHYNDYIDWDFSGKEVFQNLIIKRPYLLYKMLFTVPSITYDYLDTSYDRGCKVINALGEKNAIDIVESVELVNPEILDDINYYIINDEDLQERISTLQVLNYELDEATPFRNYSMICKLLLILFYVYIIRCAIVGFFVGLFEGKPIMSVIFDLLWFKNWELAGVCMFLFSVIDDLLGCETPSPT